MLRNALIFQKKWVMTTFAQKKWIYDDLKLQLKGEFCKSRHTLFLLCL